jgi:hypothetical protein
VLFQAVWFACVFGGDMVGLPVAAVALGIHFAFMGTAGEWRLLAATGLTGLVVDTLLMHLGILSFPAWTGLICPLWLLAIWIAFGILFLHSLHWLTENPVLAMLFGAAGGPLSYYGAARAHTVDITATPAVGISVLAVEWALLMLAFSLLTQHLEPRAQRSIPLPKAPDEEQQTQLNRR